MIEKIEKFTALVLAVGAVLKAASEIYHEYNEQHKAREEKIIVNTTTD